MKKNKTVKVVSLLVIGIALIISLYPVVWLVLSSFKSTQELFSVPDIFIAKEFSHRKLYRSMDFRKYGSVFQKLHFMYIRFSDPDYIDRTSSIVRTD